MPPVTDTDTSTELPLLGESNHPTSPSVSDFVQSLFPASDRKGNEPIETSVFLPCLNECETAGDGPRGEVIVANNRSTDGSIQIAQAAGVRVQVQECTYGNALKGAPCAEEISESSPSDTVPQFNMVSVIIPVYNERKTVMTLLQKVARQPLSLHKELIIVDDFSTDGTREFLQQTDLKRMLGGDGANTLKLVLHEKNTGKGAGVRTGLEHASGELVLIQDADLEYDPRDYPLLITPILEGHADAVFGNRFHNGPHRVPRYWRFVLNRVFSTVCNMLTGLYVQDVTACYKIFRRELLERMNLRSDRFSIETEMTVKVAKLGARVYEVPIAYHGRTYAEGKKIDWTDGIVAFYHLLRYRFEA
jgi:glycosyltransferase involved in cell wall biosynthesis